MSTIAAALAEALRTLETVTPEMLDAGLGRECYVEGVYLSMLRTSPLVAPK